MPCPAILQSGDSKGKVCGKKPKYGQYCGIHKNHQQKQRENAAAVGIASSSAGLRASSGSSSLVWHYHQPAEASDRTADPTAARSSVGNVARERRIWKRSNSKDDLLKLMADNCCGTAEQKDDGGSMKAAEVLVCQRRLIAKLWRNGTIRRASAYGYDWAKDLDLVAYLSPFARCKKIELEFIADSLGLQLTTPYEDTKADLLRAVVRAMEARNPNSGQSNLCAAVVEPTGENFRRALFEQVFFGADGLIDVLKAKPDKVVWEAKNALEWALADCMAITQASTGIMKNRVEWLKGLKKHLISADTVQAHPLKGAWDKAQEASKRVQWELATLNDFPEMYEKLAYHHVGAAFDVYPSVDSHEQEARLVSAGTGKTSWRSDACFQKLGLQDLDQAMKASLRKPQYEALVKVHEHHKRLDGVPALQVGEVLSLEAEAAIATLRYAFQAAIRKSYFSSANNDIEQTKKNIASLLAAVRKRVAHLGGETVPAGGHRSSLIVLPTGLGKSVVICLLPYVLPLQRTGRVLVIAPNLTIAGSVDKNVQAEGLMKDFCDTQWNCYRTHNLLPANSPLPKVGSLKDLRPGDAESLTDKDVIVTNYQKLKPNLLESQFPHDFFDAIIVDEAHHAESQSYKFIFEHFAAAHKVFLTATPHRSDRKELAAPLIYRTSMKVCIALEYIKDVVYCPVPVEGYELVDTRTHSVVKSIKGWNEVQKDGLCRKTQDAALASQAVRSSIIQHAMDCLRWLRKRTGHMHQAIVQAVDIADAVEICEQWIRHPGNGCKFSIDFVSSNDIKLTESEKSWHRRSNDRVKQDLRDGKLDIIVHVGMLGEGFDHKRLSVAVIFRPFRNIGSYSQFVGRAIRRNTTHTKGKDFGREEQVAYVIAHPASGMGEAWKIYCLERQDNVEELKPEGSRSNEPLVLRNQQLRASPFMDGTVLGVIGEAKQDCRVQLFPRGLSPEDKRLVEESKTSQLKPTVIGSSTPKGVLSAGSSVFRSPGSSTSSTASYSGVNGQLQSNIVPAVVPRRASGITPRRLDTSYTE